MKNNNSPILRRNLIQLLILTLVTLLGVTSCGNPRSQKSGEKLTKEAIETYAKNKFDKFWELRPHEMRVTFEEKATRKFMKAQSERVDKAGGIKRIEAAGETIIEKNSADGPTQIGITYNVTLKNGVIDKVFTGAKIIDGQWYVHRFNWTKGRKP